MHTVVEWPHDMELGEMVYLSHYRNIVSLHVILDPFSMNRNQGYNPFIHDFWAIMKGMCCDRHRSIQVKMPNAHQSTALVGIQLVPRCPCLVM